LKVAVPPSRICVPLDVAPTRIDEPWGPPVIDELAPVTVRVAREPGVAPAGATVERKIAPPVGEDGARLS